MSTLFKMMFAFLVQALRAIGIAALIAIPAGATYEWFVGHGSGYLMAAAIVVLLPTFALLHGLWVVGGLLLASKRLQEEFGILRDMLAEGAGWTLREQSCDVVTARNEVFRHLWEIEKWWRCDDAARRMMAEIDTECRDLEREVERAIERAQARRNSSDFRW